MKNKQVQLQTKKFLSIQKNKKQKKKVKKNEKTSFIMEKHLQIIYLIRG